MVEYSGIIDLYHVVSQIVPASLRRKSVEYTVLYFTSFQLQ